MKPRTGRRGQFASICAITILLFVAFESDAYQQPNANNEQHDQNAAAAMAAAVAQSGAQMMSLGNGGAQSESSSALESAGVMAPDDLIAAESSQSPDSPAEHKSFTSAQVIRQDPQQMPASVAPIYNQQQQQQQQAPQMQPGQQMYPAHLAARLQQSPHKPNFNPYMAAALAQQQMAAAAAAGMHSQVPHAPVHHPHAHQHQQQQHQQQHHHQPPPPHHHHHPALQQQQQQHQIGQHHQIQSGPMHKQQQQVVGLHPQQQQQPMQQQMGPMAAASAVHQAPPAAMAVQESTVRHEIVSAPSGNQFVGSNSAASASSIDSNTIDSSESAAHQQNLATASSAQHPVIATATSLAPLSGGGGNQEAWPLQAPDIPKIVNLEVKCEKNLMKVSVEFDKIFNGVIFSKGHFSQGQCIHVAQNSGKQQAYFDISINSCGTQGNTQNGLYGMGGNTGSGTFFENTIVIQYDPNVQEVYDHARKLRCTWHDQYEKAVTFRPFPVDMLDIVRADFAGDNVGCWMQIQVGKGPWASEVAGIVKIGQTMTMVLAIKDEENKFDMLVRNCFAHDGKRGPIELVDKSGCITRPKLMSRFTKIKNFGSSATVLSYAHFQAFKFPDSMEVHFQCTIQICRHQCPEQCASGPNVIGGPGGAGESYSESTISGTFNINSNSGSSATAAGPDGAPIHLRKIGSASSALNRARRDTSSHHINSRRWLNGSHHTNKPLTQNVGLNRVIQVVSTGDLAFAVQQQKRTAPDEADSLNGDLNSQQQPEASQLTRVDLGANQICMSSYNFVLALVMLVLILLCSCLLAISLYVRQRSLLNGASAKQAQFGQQQQTRTGSSTNKQHQAADHHLHHHNVPTNSSLHQQQQLFSQMYDGCRQ